MASKIFLKQIPQRKRNQTFLKEDLGFVANYSASFVFSLFSIKLGLAPLFLAANCNKEVKLNGTEASLKTFSIWTFAWWRDDCLNYWSFPVKYETRRLLVTNVVCQLGAHGRNFATCAPAWKDFCADSQLSRFHTYIGALLLLTFWSHCKCIVSVEFYITTKNWKGHNQTLLTFSFIWHTLYL